MNTLKRCPFCGAEKVKTKMLESPGLKVAVVYCTKCGGQQRCLGDMKDAIKMWNNRRDIKIDELNILKSFIHEAEFYIELYRNQFCSLWTAYCLRHNLIVDTMAYDKDLEELWHIITTRTAPDTRIWHSYEEFENFMCKWLI